MLVILENDGSRDDRDRVLEVARGLDLEARAIDVDGRQMVRVSGYSDRPRAELFGGLPGVALVLPVGRAPRLVDRVERDSTVIKVGRSSIGGGRLMLIAGPCAVENEDQLLRAAQHAKECGADMLRGGAYKPRTSPREFQGLGVEGLRILERARTRTGLPVVTEAVDERSFDLIEESADVVQIGSRNMQNFELLKRAGRSPRPILLKRGMWATLEELLMSAEYVLEGGNPAVILCERGIRTFSDHSRYTLDIAIVPLLKRTTHLPVIVDPSHATGNRESVPALACASVAAGADGVMVELHPDPAAALCDGPQSLTPAVLAELSASLRAIEPIVARRRETVP